MFISQLKFLSIPFCLALLTACSSQEAPKSTAQQEETQVKELANKSKEAAKSNPFFMEREIYLRGEMNDYGVQSPYLLRQFTPNTYCTLAPLRADWTPYRFKFADAAWSEGTNFGFATPPAVLRQGSAKALLNPNSRFEELQFEVDQDGIYRFCIEYENDLPYASVVLLEDSKLTTMDEIIKKEIEEQFATPASNVTISSSATK